MDRSYSGYEAWKGWGPDQFMVVSDTLRQYYSIEFKGLPVSGERVLEIGFGSGSLLAWLREQGADVYGTELSSQGIALAKEQGIGILPSDISNALEHKGNFSIVAAFDVFEHLEYREISDLLDHASILLRPSGYLIARFPNGASPFGRSIQHGDVTHVSTLTISKIKQILADKPFTIERAGDTATALDGGIGKRMAKRCRNVIRYAFEAGLRALYGLDGPLHPNLTIVLRRT